MLLQQMLSSLDRAIPVWKSVKKTVMAQLISKTFCLWGDESAMSAYSAAIFAIARTMNQSLPGTAIARKTTSLL
jgi:hypothetical protein